jgi:hypothetical protein
MEKVLVKANRATNYGGGVYSDESILGMVRSEVNQNAVTDAKGSGGGVYLQQSSLLADDSTVSFNEAALSGGGLFARIRSTIILNGCEVSDNFNVGEAGVGGGIFIKDDVVLNLLNRTSIARNHVLNDGGGLYSDSLCTIEIRDSGFYENRAADEGGGFYVSQNSAVQLVRSDIIQNEALYYGGGGVILSSTMDVSESTISSNTVTLPGGRGAGLYGDNNAVYRITGTHFVENEARGGSGAGILIATNTEFLPSHRPSTGALYCYILRFD